MSNSRLHDLLHLSFVPRWSIIPTTRLQSVAEHSFRVCAIVQEIVGRIPFSGTIQAVRWALMHDGPECATSDIPGNLKTDFLEFEDMLTWMENFYCPWYVAEKALPSDREKLIVRLADHIECLSFITEHIARPAMDGWVIHRERKIVNELTEQGVSRYGWAELPAIVSEILDEPVIN